MRIYDSVYDLKRKNRCIFEDNLTTTNRFLLNIHIFYRKLCVTPIEKLADYRLKEIRRGEANLGGLCFNFKHDPPMLLHCKNIVLYQMMYSNTFVKDKLSLGLVQPSIRHSDIILTYRTYSSLYKLYHKKYQCPLGKLTKLYPCNDKVLYIV